MEENVAGEENATDYDSVAIPMEKVSGSISDVLSEKGARLWALVLDSRAIPCHLENDDSGWHLMVPPNQLETAIFEIRLFLEENRNWPPPHPLTHPLTENTLATLSLLLLLATFYNITRLDLTLLEGRPIDWMALGNANPAEILDGQWWRLVTALTLHADLLHLVSNLAIGSIFIIFLCRDLGSGLAWTLILCSGVLGNLVNVLVQPWNHHSVGSSTALFGTVGILAGVRMIRSPSTIRKRRLLLPGAAALALLCTLGTEGKQTDLGAHLFGFLSGSVLGVVGEYLIKRNGRPSRRLNALLALLGIMIVVWAWWEALGYGLHVS
jgi:rhomboid protease GluP